MSKTKILALPFLAILVLAGCSLTPTASAPVNPNPAMLFHLLFSLLLNLAIFPIFGLPFIVYDGLFTLLLFLIVAFIGRGEYKGWLKIPFFWHPLMATLAIISALIHALLGLSIYLKF